jgi:hypothetical protein
MFSLVEKIIKHQFFNMNDKPNANNSYGYSSLIFGILGLIVIVMSMQAQSFRNPRVAVFLGLLDRFGWVSKGPKALVTEMKPSPFLSFTDGSILQILIWFGVYLSSLAILFGLWAEHRKEQSLLLSAGLMCGILGFYVFHGSTGFGMLVLCAGVVTWLRTKR